MLFGILGVDPASMVSIEGDGGAVRFEKGADMGWMHMVNAVLAWGGEDCCFDGEELERIFVQALTKTDSLPIWAAVPGVPGAAVCRRFDKVVVCIKSRVYCMQITPDKDALVEVLKKHAACASMLEAPRYEFRQT